MGNNVRIKTMPTTVVMVVADGVVVDVDLVDMVEVIEVISRTHISTTSGTIKIIIVRKIKVKM